MDYERINRPVSVTIPYKKKYPDPVKGTAVKIKEGDIKVVFESLPDLDGYYSPQNVVYLDESEPETSSAPNNGESKAGKPSLTPLQKEVIGALSSEPLTTQAVAANIDRTPQVVGGALKKLKSIGKADKRSNGWVKGA